jgi:DNA modification methylase
LLAKGRPPLPKLPLADVMDMPYSGNKLHPTQKPIQALVPLIRSFTLPGELVLDPFAGSGSSCAAALLTGRKYLGRRTRCHVFQSRVRSTGTCEGKDRSESDLLTDSFPP